MMANMKSNYTQEIFLPSKGYLNPEIPKGRILQRCMMVTDQKFLAGYRGSADYAMNELLKRTSEEPEDLDIGKLTAADTLFILFKLRILSYGSEYSYRTRCPECGRKIDVTVDLSKLHVRELAEDYEDRLIAVLPNSGDKVYTRILTNNEIIEIKEEAKRRNKKSIGMDGNEYIIRLASIVKKIELKEANEDKVKELTHPIDIQKYVENLTDLDASAIQATQSAVEFGVEPTIEYQCPECGEYMDLDIQFDNSFFRPKFNL